MAVYTTIDDAGSFYSTKLFTGTGSSLGVTGVGFQPDIVWIKNRDTTDFHVLTDAVNGATKYLSPDDTTVLTTNVESLKTFDSDGFTVGTQNEVNTNTEDYASWNWKAGTTTGIAGSPSITPTSYSFNQTSGCSIILYDGGGVSGDTVPHGLGVAPELIIVKGIDSTYWWATYSKYLDATAPEDYYLKLNDVLGKTNDLGYWNDTAPSSTLFSLGDDSNTNNSSATYIAYCFASVQGFSKLGSYIGNGNADGAFVYTGFRPAFAIVKYVDATDQGWVMLDNKRLGYNFANWKLYANSTAAETLKNFDFLSNGFKFRDASDTFNKNGGRYIYMAFAEAPFVNSSSVPVNAR